ncbi:hypothetical protein C2E23DRAFT_461532 [Lenzites betulinus]|nr:hypothetical protein C2E23DRAFT_461532 [Lenzites betulinus]
MDRVSWKETSMTSPTARGTVWTMPTTAPTALRTQTDIGCMCEDPNARKRATNCISSRCSVSDTTEVPTVVSTPTTTRVTIGTTPSSTTVRSTSLPPATAPLSTNTSAPPEGITTAPISNMPTQVTSAPADTGTVDGHPSSPASGAPATSVAAPTNSSHSSATPTTGLPGAPLSSATLSTWSSTVPRSHSSALVPQAASSSQTASSAGSSPSQHPEGGHGLSPKAFIPVSVAIVVVVLTAVLGALILCMRRRRRRRASALPAGLSKQAVSQSAEDDPYTRLEKRNRTIVDERPAHFGKHSLQEESALASEGCASLWTSDLPIAPTSNQTRTETSGANVYVPLPQAVSGDQVGGDTDPLYQASLSSGGAPLLPRTHPVNGEETFSSYGGARSNTETPPSTETTVQPGGMVADARRLSLGTVAFVGGPAVLSETSEKTAASGRHPSANATSPPPQPPSVPARAETLLTSTLSPSSLRRPRFVTVLMEVNEGDSEEDDQLPPYQPRSQSASPVSHRDHDGP